MKPTARTPVSLSAPAALNFHLGFTRDPLKAIARCYGKYGPFVQIPLPRLSNPHACIILAAGSEFNRIVLGDPATWRTSSIFPCGRKNSAARRIGQGLIRMNGRPHAHYRKLITPPLQRSRVDEMGGGMIRLAGEAISAWPKDQQVDLRALGSRLMQELTLGLLFADDREHGFRVAQRLSYGARFTWSLSVAACPVNVPGLPYRRMLKNAEGLESEIVAWSSCKRGHKDDSDLLSIIVNSPDEKGQPASNEKIVGQIPTIFGASFETCQNALIWTLILLDQHPEVARLLVEELSGNLGRFPPTLEKIVELPLLDAVVKESMRILPPVPQQFRVAKVDAELFGTAVSRGTRILLSSFLTNRNVDLFPEPDSFKPERWRRIKPSSYEYAVFSAGPRGCPGFWFGLCAVKTAIALILSHFRIALTPNQRLDYKIGIAMSPRSSVKAVLHQQDKQFAASPISGQIRDLVRLPQ